MILISWFNLATPIGVSKVNVVCGAYALQKAVCYVTSICLIYKIADSKRCTTNHGDNTGSAHRHSDTSVCNHRSVPAPPADLTAALTCLLLAGTQITVYYCEMQRAQLALLQGLA